MLRQSVLQLNGVGARLEDRALGRVILVVIGRERDVSDLFVVDLYDVQVRLEVGVMALGSACVSVGFDDGVTSVITGYEGINVRVIGHLRAAVQAQKCDKDRGEDFSHFLSSLVGLGQKLLICFGR
ncbi:hypothetical protein D3C79_776210 [compost metagenome]